MKFLEEINKQIDLKNAQLSELREKLNSVDSNNPDSTIKIQQLITIISGDIEFLERFKKAIFL